MKAKEWVKNELPNAVIKKEGNLYKVMADSHKLTMCYFGAGKTEAQAWNNAKKHLLSCG